MRKKMSIAYAHGMSGSTKRRMRRMTEYAPCAAAANKVGRAIPFAASTRERKKRARQLGVLCFHLLLKYARHSPDRRPAKRHRQPQRRATSSPCASWSSRRYNPKGGRSKAASGVESSCSPPTRHHHCAARGAHLLEHGSASGVICARPSANRSARGRPEKRRAVDRSFFVLFLIAQ